MTSVQVLARVCGAACTLAGAAAVAGRQARTGSNGDHRRLERDLGRLEEIFRDRLHTQLESARRYERRFTLTSTELAVPDPGHLVVDCASHIRVLDALAFVDGALLALWWDSGPDAAEAAISRLVDEGRLPPASRHTTGSATFPVDGLTAISLVEFANEERCRPPRSTEPGRSDLGGAARTVRLAPLATSIEPDRRKAAR
jgi:hypothetical protein